MNEDTVRKSRVNTRAGLIRLSLFWPRDVAQRNGTDISAERRPAARATRRGQPTRAGPAESQRRDTGQMAPCLQPPTHAVKLRQPPTVLLSHWQVLEMPTHHPTFTSPSVLRLLLSTLRVGLSAQDRSVEPRCEPTRVREELRP